jgi:hypothetical protein
MGLPRETVPLTAGQVAGLDRQLSEMRHNVNNHLALMVAALELIRRKPDTVPRVIESLMEQPQRVLDEIRRFCAEFEQALKITRE